MEPTPLARFLKRRRKSLKKRVIDVARAMEVSAPTVCQWELGIRRPRAARLTHLAEVLDVPVTELLRRMR